MAMYPQSYITPHIVITRRLWRTHGRMHVLLLSLLILMALQRFGLAAPPLWSEQKTPEMPVPALQHLNEALITLTERLLPAVISLRVQTDKDTALPENHPPTQDQEPVVVAGSGFLIRADGLALTNYHVIEKSKRIDVLLHDGTQTTASVLGRDPIGDLALLQVVTDKSLQVMPLGTSTNLRVGELVVAIGTPFGFEHTVTFGIVSAKQRSFLRSGVMGGYIQTDAAITSGNSGGPLINMRGEVVGINVATLGRGDMGFAIPIDAIKVALPQLYDAGRVARGWLGVRISAVDRDQIQSLGLEAPRGVYVRDVMQGQPAHQAGLTSGDIIVRFDGYQVNTPFDLQRAVAATPVGKTVQVEFVRKRARQTLQLALGSMPDQ
jgi:serine protease Do